MSFPLQHIIHTRVDAVPRHTELLPVVALINESFSLFYQQDNTGKGGRLNNLNNV